MSITDLFSEKKSVKTKPFHLKLVNIRVRHFKMVNFLNNMHFPNFDLIFIVPTKLTDPFSVL